MSKLPFQEVLWKKLNENGTLIRWVADGYLRKTDNEWIWTQKALDELGIVQALPLTMDLDWIAEYVEKFTKKNIGISGKTSSESVIKDRMKRFLKEYKFDKQTILKATDLYIKTKLGQGSAAYIREAHYFIYKKLEKGVENSDLATWCESFLREDGDKAQSKFNDRL